MMKALTISDRQEKITLLKNKILQREYIQMAINEIAVLLSESIKKRNFYFYERKAK